MKTFPTEWKSHEIPWFQTTNQSQTHMRTMVLEYESHHLPHKRPKCKSIMVNILYMEHMGRKFKVSTRLTLTRFAFPWSGQHVLPWTWRWNLGRSVFVTYLNIDLQQPWFPQENAKKTHGGFSRCQIHEGKLKHPFQQGYATAISIAISGVVAVAAVASATAAPAAAAAIARVVGVPSLGGFTLSQNYPLVV